MLSLVMVFIFGLMVFVMKVSGVMMLCGGRVCLWIFGVMFILVIGRMVSFMVVVFIDGLVVVFMRVIFFRVKNMG